MENKYSFLEKKIIWSILIFGKFFYGTCIVLFTSFQFAVIVTALTFSPQSGIISIALNDVFVEVLKFLLFSLVFYRFSYFFVTLPEMIKFRLKDKDSIFYFFCIVFSFEKFTKNYNKE